MRAARRDVGHARLSRFVDVPLSPELLTVVAQTKGFLPEVEAAALYDAAAMAQPGLWLEVGTYCGKSTVVLGGAARVVGSTLVTLDHHRGSEENQVGWEWHDASLVDPEIGQLDTLPSLRTTLKRANLEDIVTPIIGSTQSIGLAPCSMRAAFARVKGRDPKNPRLADSGLGWADEMIGVLPSRSVAVAASRPHRIATSG